MNRRTQSLLFFAATMLAVGVWGGVAQQANSTRIAGGRGGSPFEDGELAQGARIAEVRIRAGDAIDAVQLVYVLPDGRASAGARHGGGGGREYIFTLDRDEYITGISGRFGDTVDSLRIHTNKRTSTTYGGRGGDNDFRMDVPAGSQAIGLVGRSGNLLDAIGLAYAVRYRQSYLPQRGLLGDRSGSGMAGGNGGSPFADSELAQGAKITEVRIRAGDTIDAVQLIYAMPDGRVSAGPRHGGGGGREYIFTLDSDEYITGISGRYGDTIDSMRIHTNKRTSPVFGGRGGSRDFRIDVPSGNQAAGFVGRSGDTVDAIGLASTQVPSYRYAAGTAGQSASPALAGGRGGSPFADSELAQGARISEVRIRAGDTIDAVQLIYAMPDGRVSAGPRHGGGGGREYIFTLDSDEYITGISGRYGDTIDSMRIHTNKRTSPVFGGRGGSKDFSIDVPTGNQAVGFVGRSGDTVDAIGLASAQRQSFRRRFRRP